ncbi:MAG TPA: chromosomal replication initiator DnaA, partial [Xanthobacteraceae bacterium]|nr:chromosomal replication initiator DnaA [Xanthobacteraceae bacterium]
MRGGEPNRNARPRQLALALGHEESLAREDFLEGPSNATALKLLEAWPDWPAPVVMLTGPEGSGKSHLAAIWAAASGARVIGARALTETSPPMALATGALVIEDLGAGEFDEASLFHMLNL